MSADIALEDKIKAKLDIVFANINIQDLAVAISGGADSMALCLIANNWAKVKNINFHAITINHNLRIESEDEAKTITNWLKKYNINHHIITWQHSNPKSNIQAQAREARYHLIAKFCDIHNIKYLLVAHNIEDKIETFLDRLSRGSGLDGLASMEEKIKFSNIQIIRPLLNTEKIHLRNYLSSINQEWIEDPSNINQKFKRIKIRQLLENIEEKSLIIKRISQTADHLARVKDYINSQVNLEFNNNCKIELVDKIPQCLINHKVFIQIHEELALRILVKALSIVSDKPYKPRFEKLMYLYKQIKNNQNFKKLSLNNCLISGNDNNYILIERENKIEKIIYIPI